MTNIDLELALSAIPQKRGQVPRLVKFLAENAPVNTATIARRCSIGNVSDCASRANEHLFKVNYFISCNPPAAPVFNQFGEKSPMYIWDIYTLGEGASDEQ